MPILNNWELAGLFLLIITCIVGIQYLHIRRYVLKPLSELEERYRQIFNNSLNAIAFHEAVSNAEDGGIDYRFLEVNRAFEEMTGLKVNDVVGKTLSEVLPEEEQAIFREIYSQVAESGEAGLHEKYSSSLGRHFQVAAISPMPNCYTAIFTDITDRKVYEQSLKDQSAWLETIVEERQIELRQAQDQLIQREKMVQLGQLARGIAHELRNPLGVISNAVYYLKSISNDTESDTQEYLDIIETEVSNSERTIADLLEYSREPKPTREPTDLSAILKAILARIPTPDGIRVTTNLSQELPLVYVDGRHIGMVLTNLITNAYQAMPNGGDLTIDISHRGDEVRLAMYDTGPGIPEKNITSIFEPFYTTKPKGIGLGLAISKTLVEVNHGRIEVASAEGQGSTFTLVLPKSDEA